MKLKHFEVGSVYTIEPGVDMEGTFSSFSTQSYNERALVPKGNGMLCVGSIWAPKGLVSEVVFLTQDINGKVVEVVTDDSQSMRNYLTRLL